MVDMLWYVLLLAENEEVRAWKKSVAESWDFPISHRLFQLYIEINFRPISTMQAGPFSADRVYPAAASKGKLRRQA
jgi:hypothetical protein